MYCDENKTTEKLQTLGRLAQLEAVQSKERVFLEFSEDPFTQYNGEYWIENYGPDNSIMVNSNYELPLKTVVFLYVVDKATIRIDF